MRRTPRRLAATATLAVALSGLAWAGPAGAGAAGFTTGGVVVVRIARLPAASAATSGPTARNSG